MRIIVVGLGVQGNKRFEHAKDSVVAIVDPINPKADYKNLQEVSLQIYDAVILSTPDEYKYELIKFALENKKHVMVEKPLSLNPITKYSELEQIANSNNCFLYTAYNHRFETHFQNIKSILKDKVLGNIYSCKLFYGNGTAKLVKESNWRDEGSGVILDLGSHLFDVVDYWFSASTLTNVLSNVSRFENKSPDSANILFEMSGIQFNLGMSLCSWKNTFTCDIVGSKGSLNLNGLRKWGQSVLIHRTRKLPSGVPDEMEYVENEGDPTWDAEYNFFLSQIDSRQQTNLKKDEWIFKNLELVYGQSA
jgi:predicted dehydrogenase